MYMYTDAIVFYMCIYIISHRCYNSYMYMYM